MTGPPLPTGIQSVPDSALRPYHLPNPANVSRDAFESRRAFWPEAALAVAVVRSILARTVPQHPMIFRIFAASKAMPHPDDRLLVDPMKKKKLSDDADVGDLTRRQIKVDSTIATMYDSPYYLRPISTTTCKTL